MILYGFFDIISQLNCQHRTRNAQNMSHTNVRRFLKNSCFQSLIIECNKLDSKMRNSEALNIFLSKISKFIEPTANSISGCQNPIWVRLLTRLRLGLDQHREDKFKHSFQDTLYPLCSSRKEVATFHFLLLCHNYSKEILILLSKIRNINSNILENTNSQITQFFLYGDENFTGSTNFIILNSTIEYMLGSKRFDEPLFLYQSPFLIKYLFHDLYFSYDSR